MNRLIAFTRDHFEGSRVRDGDAAPALLDPTRRIELLHNRTDGRALGAQTIRPELMREGDRPVLNPMARASLRGLAEGQKISYEVEAGRRSGKESAVDLKTA
jgi:hypothetical protein